MSTFKVVGPPWRRFRRWRLESVSLSDNQMSFSETDGPRRCFCFCWCAASPAALFEARAASIASRRSSFSSSSAASASERSVSPLEGASSLQEKETKRYSQSKDKSM